MKVLLLAVLTALLICTPVLAQDAKTEKDNGTMVVEAGSFSGSGASDVKLKEGDAAKVQNLQLVLTNLQLQIQNAQLQAELIKKDIPSIVDALYKQYGLSKDEWAFDEQKMQFTKKVKP